MDDCFADEYIKSYKALFSFIILALVLFLSVLLPASAAAVVDATLEWDASSGADGYRLFYRQDGQSYDYGSPDWEGVSTTCTIYGLDDATTYHFVVRAFNEDGESGNSNEEHLYPTGPNLAPNKPVITSPYNGEMETDLLLTVETKPFSDPDGDTQRESRWQIIKQADSSVVLDITSSEHLTALPVPHTVLDRNTTYYVSVRFYDSYSAASEWSDAVLFTTDSIIIDLDADGIPDDREVDDSVDLNNDGTPDNDQPDVIKSILSAVGDNEPFGVSKISASIDAIEVLEPINPSTILDKTNKPETFLFGLASYRLSVSQVGATVMVRVYYPEDISEANRYYLYDTINGWQDYTQYVTFNPDGRSVTVELQDGGHGDSDGVANGVIVDPGGVAGAATGGVDSGSGSGCFIATTAFGSYSEPYVNLHAASYIEEHAWLKPIVRVLLMPLVAISYILMRTSLVTIILLAFMLIVSVLSFYALIYKMRKYQV